MLRIAIGADIAALKAVRSAVVENVLSDPSKVTDDDYAWFVVNPGIFVWEETGTVIGFSAADPRDGSIWALFVTPGFEKRGIGSSLLGRACDCLRQSGFKRAWLTTDPDTRAERFYRAAGWQHVGEKENELLFEMPL